MANPVIAGVQVLYPQGQTNLRPGQSAVIVVDASDADARTVEFTVTVRDGDGNEGTSSGTVVVTDPLTYSATATGGSIAQVPGQPNRFTLTV